VCPKNHLGEASVYLVAHHGDYDTNVPALYAAQPTCGELANGSQIARSAILWKVKNLRGKSKVVEKRVSV
jgi:hypothetical protein